MGYISCVLEDSDWKFSSSFVLFLSFYLNVVCAHWDTCYHFHDGEQMIDRICVKVQDHLNSLRNCGGDAVQEDLKSAERLMRDAKNSKTVSFVHLGDVSILCNKKVFFYFQF